MKELLVLSNNHRSVRNVDTHSVRNSSSLCSSAWTAASILSLNVLQIPDSSRCQGNVGATNDETQLTSFICLPPFVQRDLNYIADPFRGDNLGKELTEILATEPNEERYAKMAKFSALHRIGGAIRQVAIELAKAADTKNIHLLKHYYPDAFVIKNSTFKEEMKKALQSGDSEGIKNLKKYFSNFIVSDVVEDLYSEHLQKGQYGDAETLEGGNDVNSKTVVSDIVIGLADNGEFTDEHLENSLKLLDRISKNYPKAFSTFKDSEGFQLLCRNDLFQRLRRSPKGLGFIITLLLHALKPEKQSR